MKTGGNTIFFTLLELGSLTKITLMILFLRFMQRLMPCIGLARS
jgi:hypothetical protein